MDILNAPYKLLNTDPYYHKDPPPKGELIERETKWQVSWKYIQTLAWFTKKKFVLYVKWVDEINEYNKGDKSV